MKRQHILLTVFTFLIILIPFAYQTNYLQADESDYYSKIRMGLKYFQKVYDRVQSHYVEEIDPYEFVKSGIEGMLGTLDPYTVFIEQEGDARLQIITTGKYGGLGMEIGIRNNQVTIISPMDNSPAQRAGVQAGDIIEEINGVDVRNISLEKISQKLRGPIGSEAEIVLRRPGYTGEIIMNIKRAEIVIEDVSYAGFVAPGIAYIRLISFTDKAGIEMRQAIRDLEKENRIEAMILDLRGNSGGLLEAAVEVLGVFLPKGTTVVKTKGFRDGEHAFETQTDPILLETPLALLVDNGSASASEIVAGAFQDLDRAIIVGSNTFGKGLVQKVYSIDKNSNTKIKITTAKYYIPSGRCVQKQDYTQNKSVFYNQDSDSVSKDDHKKPYYTFNKRIVFENGGITPDRQAYRDDMSFVVAELWRQSLIFNFCVQYHQEHPEWAKDFELTDQIYQDFISFVKEKDFEYRIESENELLAFLETARGANLPGEIIDDGQAILSKLQSQKQNDLFKHQEEIRRILLQELVEKYAGNHEKIFYSLKTDSQVHEALDVIRNQNEYKKILAMQ